MKRRLLAYLIQPRAIPSGSHESDQPAREQGHSSRISGALSSSIVSIGDLFSSTRDGSKSVKFPKELIKVLEQRLENIAMGRDSSYVSVSHFGLRSPCTPI